MLGSMSQHLRVIVGLLDDLALKDTETRVANWLLKRCPRPLRDSPAVIELDRTKRVLAAELGATSETLSRTSGIPRPEATAGGWAQDHDHAAAQAGSAAPGTSRQPVTRQRGREAVSCRVRGWRGVFVIGGDPTRRTL